MNLGEVLQLSSKSDENVPVYWMSFPKSSIIGFCFGVFCLSLAVPLPSRYAFEGLLPCLSHSRKNAIIWKLSLVSSVSEAPTLKYSHACWVFLKQRKIALISHQWLKVKWNMLLSMHSSAERSCALGISTLYFLKFTPALLPLGLLVYLPHFHAYSAEASPSFPVLARPLLTKFLTISGKVKLLYQGLTSPELWWSCVRV